MKTSLMYLFSMNPGGNYPKLKWDLNCSTVLQSCYDHVRAERSTLKIVQYFRWKKQSAWYLKNIIRICSDTQKMLHISLWTDSNRNLGVSQLPQNLQFYSLDRSLMGVAISVPSHLPKDKPNPDKTKPYYCLFCSAFPVL